MVIIDKAKNIFKKAIMAGATPHNLTRSFCMGLYIAFSPFPGAHTVMMVATKYLFNLHFPTLFLATSINNPWTMIPFFSFDYAFGYWFVHSVLKWEPTWIISLEKFFGVGKICVWSFLIGGNLLGIIAAILFWPVMKKLFNHLGSHQHSEYRI